MFHVDICQKMPSLAGMQFSVHGRLLALFCWLAVSCFPDLWEAFPRTLFLAPSHNFWIPSLTITFLLYHPQTERYGRNVYSRYFSEMCVYLLCDAGKSKATSIYKYLQVKLVNNCFCPSSQYFQIYKALYRN